MTIIKFFLISSLLINSVQAEIEITGEDDVLSTVSQKLTQVENHLKDQRLFVSSARFEWKELDEFRDELMFVVAHDPAGSTSKDTPAELMPTYLTQKLRLSFARLEASVYQIGSLVKNEEWVNLKQDMEKFLNQRDEFLYVPARGMIKSGLMTNHLKKLKEVASIILNTNENSKNISVRVVDPVIENLSKELNRLNVSVRQLEEFRKPVAVEPTTIFQEKNYVELSIFSLFILSVGIFGTFVFQWLAGKFSKKEVVEPVSIKENTFNYFEWLKQLEGNLKAFKTNEEKLTEECINLKHLSHVLSESRKGLNLADNQQDYYESLEKLNGSAPKIEEYFHKISVKKNSELSRRLVKQVVHLCEAIESRREIVFTENKDKMRASKVDAQIIELNAA